MINRGITFKLTAGFVSMVLISMLIIGMLFINMFRGYVLQNKEESMISSARDIAEITSQYLSSEGSMRGYGAFMMLLDTMVEARVWITDKDGQVVMSSGTRNGMMHQNQTLNPIPEEAKKTMSTVLSGSESVGESFSSVYNEATLTVGVPVSYNDMIVGSVFLHAPVTGISETVNKATNILLIGIFFAVLSALIFGIYYSNRFTNPLKKMNVLALEMADGNYSVRTNIKQSDEIGQLSNSLDIMAQQLGFTIEQLFQEKTKLNDIISSISEGILAFDQEMKLINYNQAFLGLLNCQNEECLNKLITGEFNELGINILIKDVISTGDNRRDIIVKNNRTLKLLISAVRDISGTIIGAVLLVQDISESERLEQLRKDFVANVSHEFRTPLTLIRGSTEALIDEAVNDKLSIDKYYERILCETGNLEKLVNDLLDLSKLESGKMSLNLEKVDMVYIISDVVRAMTPVANKKSITLNLMNKTPVSPIMGDYSRLRQLMVIFIDNAIKYSPDNTKIDIALSQREQLYVMIKDNGYGISKDQLPYIWDRFYMIDHSRSSTNKGTGLGLSIAKIIVELHHGIVNIESELGKGTKIEFGLPVIF